MFVAWVAPLTGGRRRWLRHSQATRRHGPGLGSVVPRAATGCMDHGPSRLRRALAGEVTAGWRDDTTLRDQGSLSMKGNAQPKCHREPAQSALGATGSKAPPKWRPIPDARFRGLVADLPLPEARQAYHGIDFSVKPVHLLKGGGEQLTDSFKTGVNPMAQALGIWGGQIGERCITSWC